MLDATDVVTRTAARAAISADHRSAIYTAPGGLAWQLKGAMERTTALLLLIAILPALAVISIAIMLETGRPVLFRQPRFGKGGRPFDVLKFRTMQHALCDPSGAGQTQDADPRITRVGQILRKTSLDELPQLWNVVTGQMALIGPRAHPCGMRVEDHLCEMLVPQYHNRHVVRPGITGWAQVNGSRGAVKTKEALEQRVALDLDYIATWSLWLDLRILWRTVRVVLSCRQAR
jgi:polysaccharide biosynthesis protein PslA